MGEGGSDLRGRVRPYAACVAYAFAGVVLSGSARPGQPWKALPRLDLATWGLLSLRARLGSLALPPDRLGAAAGRAVGVPGAVRRWHPHQRTRLHASHARR
jgi:hypothetical protein